MKPTPGISGLQQNALHILKAVPGSFLVLLPDTPRFTIVEVSDAYLKTTFTKRAEIIGKGLFEVFPGNPLLNDARGQDKLSSSLYQVIKSRKEHRMPDHRYDLPAPYGDGLVFRYWRVLNKPVLNDTGDVGFILHCVEDVTALVNAEETEVRIKTIEQAFNEIKLTENALKESEERFRTMANSIPQLAWMTDETGWIYWYNDRWYEYTGTKPADMLGWGWKKVHHPDLVEGVVERITAAFESGSSWEDTFLLRRKDGEYRWFLSRAIPVRRDDGTLIGWFGTNTDITEQRKAEEALRQSETNLRNLVLHAPVAMCIGTGPDYVVEVANDLMLELWGKAADEIIGHPVFEVLPQTGRQGLKEVIQQVFANGDRFTAHELPVALFRHGRLETAYLNFVYEPIKNAEGKVTSIIAVAIDLTVQVLARQKIEESHKEFQFAMDFLPQIFWLTWPDGYHYYYNQRFYDYTGLGVNETKGEGWNQLFHPDDQDRARKLWTNSLITGAPYEIEYRLRRYDGEYRWFLGRALPLRDESGAITKWFGTCTEIHDQKTFTEELEREVKERTKELQQSNEDLQQFAHVSSHDLKEPLRKIKLFAHRLFIESGHCLDEKGKKYLAKVQMATDRMWNILEGVLTYSQINFIKEIFENVDLNEVIHHVVSDLEIPIQEKDAVIHYSNLPAIEGASVMLYLVFYNLVSNALKFSSPERYPVINISSEHFEIDGWPYVRIRLQDNGIGFEQEYAEKVFGTFTRLHPKDEYEGAGLGLSICRKIIERHGGSITVRSKENKGTEFEIVLPERAGLAMGHTLR